jgi:hypothetical protein
LFWAIIEYIYLIIYFDVHIFGIDKQYHFHQLLYQFRCYLVLQSLVLWLFYEFRNIFYFINFNEFSFCSEKILISNFFVLWLNLFQYKWYFWNFKYFVICVNYLFYGRTNFWILYRCFVIVVKQLSHFKMIIQEFLKNFIYFLF